jgi:hypothetical protein
MQHIALITQTEVIRKILRSVGLSADTPVAAPARSQLAFDFGA